MSDNEQDDKTFRALASSIRRRLLDALRDRPMTTSALCTTFPEMGRCSVMQHLRVLEEADLVIVKREGRQRWNYLNAVPIKRIHDRWIGDYAAEAAGLLERLERDLEPA